MAKKDKFTPGERVEYGIFHNTAIGGHWHDCEIIAVDENGQPTKIIARLARGGWSELFEPTGAKFRHLPKDPWMLRRREPSTHPNGRKDYSYFVQVSRYFPAMELGGWAAAYRFATEREAKKALDALGDARLVALRVSTAVRDQNVLEAEWEDLRKAGGA